MRQQAIRCMLSSKLIDGELKVVEQFEFVEPKTKAMVKILEALQNSGSVLLVDAQPEFNMVKSADNIPWVKTIPANLLNVVDLLSYQTLVMTESAVRKAEDIWGKQRASEA